MALRTGYFPQGFFPDGFWPQGFWPAPSGLIADWIARALDGGQDPAGSLTLRVVRPGINDYAEPHFLNADVFICGIKDRLISQTTEPQRICSAIFKLYGIIRSLPGGMAADTALSRITETIRRLILAGNNKSPACDGLAVNIDCPAVRFLPGAGFEAAEVTTIAMYSPAG